MTETTERLHLEVSGATSRELGLSRGRALSATLSDAYSGYAELFRAMGVSAAAESAGVERVLAALAEWRPSIVAELGGVAEGAGVPLAQVVALNARTEILALGRGGASECSTVAAVIDGARVAAQTWDWHIELDPFWHTHVVAGSGLRYAGLTEQGILSKIGVNEAGLALHFNILGHAQDGPGGVPMHVLSHVVLSECRTVEEALALIRETPIASSSAFTMLDAGRSVTVEMSPVGVFVSEESEGAVIRTNHFLNEMPLAEQKSALYEPDSSERRELLRERLGSGAPADEQALVALLESGPGEPPLTCVPDMALTFGERWATLATVITEPAAGTIRILDGMPTAARTGAWRVLTA